MNNKLNKPDIFVVWVMTFLSLVGGGIFAALKYSNTYLWNGLMLLMAIGSLSFGFLYAQESERATNQL